MAYYFYAILSPFPRTLSRENPEIFHFFRFFHLTLRNPLWLPGGCAIGRGTAVAMNCAVFGQLGSASEIRGSAPASCPATAGGHLAPAVEGETPSGLPRPGGGCRVLLSVTWSLKVRDSGGACGMLKSCLNPAPPSAGSTATPSLRGEERLQENFQEGITDCVSPPAGA